MICAPVVLQMTDYQLAFVFFCASPHLRVGIVFSQEVPGKMYHTTIHDSPPSQLQSNSWECFFGRIGNQKKGPETNPQKVRCVIL